VRIPSFSALGVLILLGVPAAEAMVDPWSPVPPEDLALTQGRVQADADAEALEWAIEVGDEWMGPSVKSSRSERRRIKIFNTRGRDAFNRIDIPYLNGSEVTDVAARTIRPDGSVIVVKKDAILERTLLKGAGVKMKAKSIAMPGVEPGCVVEYRWTVVTYDRLSHQLILPLQLDIPVQRIDLTLHALPLEGTDFLMRVRSFNFGIAPLTESGPNTNTTTIHNVSAYKEEPHGPPELDVRPWIVIYYTGLDTEYPVENFWRRFGKAACEAALPLSRASGEVKRATQAALPGVVDPNAIVQGLVEYCRSHLRNSDQNDSGLTADQRAWLRGEHSAADHLKKGVADSYGVLKVFLSMATAAGLDARLALVPSRDWCTFRPDQPTPYLLTRHCAAVNVFGAWRAVDPTASDLAPTLLPWPIQGVDMLVPDDKESKFVRTPVGTPEENVRRRTARLALSEEGTLEGDITDEIAGQDAAVWRRDLRGRSSLEREKRITDDLKARLSTAEVTKIRFDIPPSASEPLHIDYHVRVPGYAQRSSQRLFLQPAFFQRGDSPTFTAAKRSAPICFQHPWAETDMVTIDLPAGYHLEDSPEAQPVTLSTVAKHSVRIRLSEDGHQVQFLHSMYFGEGGEITFPAEEYPKIKKAFDDFQAQDQAVLSIASDATPR
jgi:hypothetical protein